MFGHHTKEQYAIMDLIIAKYDQRIILGLIFQVLPKKHQQVY